MLAWDTTFLFDAIADRPKNYFFNQRAAKTHRTLSDAQCLMPVPASDAGKVAPSSSFIKPFANVLAPSISNTCVCELAFHKSFHLKGC
jgi:hypothetical protein